MKLTIDRLEIKDFRQAGERSFDFKEGHNFIVGANGTGKTNTLHSIVWCLFGKDLDDRAKFEAVPLNPDNTPSELEPDVTLHLSIDGEAHTLRRQLKGGKTSQTYINGAPCKTLKEFDAFVAEIFSTPDRFKMFTNPLYFPEIHWKDQRELFMQFFPMPKANEVIDYMAKKKKKLKDLVADDLAKVSPEKLQDKLNLDQKDIDAKRNKIRNNLELLDEQLEGQQLFNEPLLTAERDALRKNVNEISQAAKTASLNNQARDKRQSELEKEIFAINFDLDNLDKKAQAKYEAEKRSREADLKFQLETAERNRDRLADDYRNLKAIDATCPTCGQELPADQIAEMEARIEQKRAAITEQGKEAAEQIKALRAELEAPETDAKPEDTAEEKNALKAQLIQLKKELKQLPEPEEVPVIEDDVLTRLDELDRTLARSEVHKENIERRDGLLDQERELSADYETCERKLQDLADFFFYRSEMIVKAVNSQFKTISVKVLEIQKNGIPKDTFEITSNGVPYSELNTASKLQAGLELSGFFKSQFDISCPVLIDNGERYNSKILSSVDGQMICALFTEGAELHIEN